MSQPSSSSSMLANRNMKNPDMMRKGQNPPAPILQRSAPETNEVEDTIAAKKKKKKKLPKEERRRRREEEKLKSIYGPKDSKVQFISAAVLQKLNNPNSQASRSSVPSFSLDDFPSVSSSPALVKKSLLEDQFPSLASSSAPKIKAPISKKFVNAPAIVTCSRPRDIVVKAEEDSAWETECEDNVEKSAPAPIVLGTPVPEVISTKRKSKAPLLISFDALISSGPEREKRKDARKAKEVAIKLEKKTVGNTLDSSGPRLMNRGKIREKPRRKKVTSLKKTILISRSLRAAKRNAERPVEQTQSTIDNNSASNAEIAIQDQGTLLSASVDVQHIKEEEDAGDSPVLHESIESLIDSSATDTAVTNLSQGAFSLPETDDAAKNASSDTELFAKLLDNAMKEQVVDKIPIETPVKVEPCPSVDPTVYAEAKKSLHSRKFRDYCDMYSSKELHGHVIALLKELHRFQDRLYHTDRVKFQTKRRFVHGLKDALNYLKINKVALILLAPDIEYNGVKGGLDDRVTEIINLSKEKNVPVVCSGNRYILGKPIKIKTPVSVIAILDKQGAEPLFQAVIEESSKLRQKYQEDFQSKIQQLTSPNEQGGALLPYLAKMHLN